MLLYLQIARQLNNKSTRTHPTSGSVHWDWWMVAVARRTTRTLSQMACSTPSTLDKATRTSSTPSRSLTASKTQFYPEQNLDRVPYLFPIIDLPNCKFLLYSSQRMLGYFLGGLVHEMTRYEMTLRDLFQRWINLATNPFCVGAPGIEPATRGRIYRARDLSFNLNI